MKSRPKLYIDKAPLEDQKLQEEIFKEIDKYSITPRTLDSRTLPTNDAVQYTDKYKYSDKDSNYEVIRYGINSMHLLVDLEKKQISGFPTEIIELKNQSQSSVKTERYTQTDAKEVILHPLEVKLIKEAIDCLLKSISRTVLVDIFAREKGSVKLLKNNCPEIHTVILYKNPLSPSGQQEILVIDPSNFLFSSHLSNITNLDNNVCIKTLHKSMHIYKPKSINETGPGQNQYRDCIDIAVKIAFGFNNMAQDLRIELKQIAEYDVIKTISNQPTIDRTIIDSDSIARIKQTSEVKIVQTFYKAEQIIDKNLKMLSSIPNNRDAVDKVKGNYKQILNDTKSDTNIILDLVTLNKNLIFDLSTQLQQDHNELNSFIQGLIGDTHNDEAVS